jgi:hypothetical protein
VPNILAYLDIGEAAAERRVIKRGRQTRHYERATSLARVRAEYLRTLEDPNCAELISGGTVLRLSSRDNEEKEAAAGALITAVLSYLAG